MTNLDYHYCIFITNGDMPKYMMNNAVLMIIYLTKIWIRQVEKQKLFSTFPKLCIVLTTLVCTKLKLVIV